MSNKIEIKKSHLLGFGSNKRGNNYEIRIDVKGIVSAEENHKILEALIINREKPFMLRQYTDGALDIIWENE